MGDHITKFGRASKIKLDHPTNRPVIETWFRHKIWPGVANEPDHHKIRSVIANELDHHDSMAPIAFNRYIQLRNLNVNTTVIMLSILVVKIRSVIELDNHKIRSVIENELDHHKFQPVIEK
jgi:hypothetical protein